MYFIFKIIALLPLWLLQFLALSIGFVLFHFNSSIKRITSINIQLAYPDMSTTATETARQSKYPKPMPDLY